MELIHAEIHRVTLEEIPPMQDQYVAGYNLTVTGNNTEQLEGINHRNPGELTVESLMPILPEMVTLDMPTVIAPIVNGWGSKRANVIVEVMATTVHNIKLMYRIGGYTDGIDHSFLTGAVPDDIVIYINTIDTIKVDSRTLAPLTCVNSNELLYDKTISPVELSTIRPMDTHVGLSAKALIDTERFLDDSDNIVDSNTNALGIDPVMSNPLNKIGGNWLANIINSRTQAINDIQQGIGLSRSTTAASASLVDEGTIYDNPFISLLIRHIGGHNVAGKLTIGDLYKIDPSLRGDDKRMVIGINSQISTESEYGNVNMIENELAKTTCHQVTSFMNTANMSSVAFNVSNRTANGLPTFAYGLPNVTYDTSNPPVTFLVNTTPIEKNSLSAEFMRSVTDILMPYVTKAGLVDVVLVVHAEVGTTMTVTVAVDHGPIRFVYPLYSTNAYNPMVSTEGSLQIAESVDVLLTGLEVAQTSPTAIRNIAEMSLQQQPLSNTDEITVFDV